jgi:hypothetical protein
LLLLLLLQVVSPFTAEGLLGDWEITQRLWEYALRWERGECLCLYALQSGPAAEVVMRQQQQQHTQQEYQQQQQPI